MEEQKFQGTRSNNLKPGIVYPAAALVAAVAAFLVFLPSLGYDFVNWDDNFLIIDNTHVRSLDPAFFKWAFTAVPINTWYPMTLISIAVDYALWGAGPRGFHLTNVILHSANTFLVALLVIRLVRLSRSRDKSPGLDKTALAAGVVTALLFALHPLRVESVVWLAERKDVLYGFFYLASVHAYLSYARPTGSGKLYYIASLFLFALGLLSKPMAVTLPVVLLIIDFCPLGRLRLEGGLKKAGAVLIEKVPFFLLSLSISLATVWAHFLSKGPAMKLDELQIFSHILVAVRGYLFYLKNMLLPLDLAPFYPFPENPALLSLEYAGSIVLLSAITAYAALSIKKNAVFSAIWFYYLVALLPVIMSFQAGTPVAAADRHTYLPCLGPFMLVGLIAGRAFERSSKGPFQAVVLVTALLVSINLAALTVKQSAVWKDPITLWSQMIIHFPDTSKAHNNRALEYQRSGELELAISDYTRAIELKPERPVLYNNRAGAYLARGGAYMKQRRFQMAISDYTTAIELRPGYAIAYFNRGSLYQWLGDYRAALEDYTRAAELKPGYARFHYNQGVAHEALGEPDRALDDYTRALGLDPGYAAAHYKMAGIYLAADQRKRAIEGYRKAAALGHKGAKKFLKESGAD